MHDLQHVKFIVINCPDIFQHDVFRKFFFPGSQGLFQKHSPQFWMIQIPHQKTDLW